MSFLANVVLVFFILIIYFIFIFLCMEALVADPLEQLHNLPTIVHCLSDTGVMSFQVS
jgi:hypothetical protein